MKKIGIVAGETSGSHLGSGLIRALQAKDPSLSFSGVGGKDMIQAGFQSLHEMDRLAVMGLVEPLRRLPELIRIRRHLYQHFTEQKPDLFIGIDSPDFNLGLELSLKKQGIPIVHYVSPSVWAWRQKRIHKIARATDLVLTLFPFEMAFYEKKGVPATFVGHPLADQIPLEIDQVVARRRLGLQEEDTYIALLPGSRRNEIHFLGETFLEAAKLLQAERPSLKFITSSANHARHQEFFAQFQKIAPQLSLIMYEEKTQDVMAAADIVLVTSGTATLETLLFKKPMVIAYRMANFTYQIAKHLVKIPYIGLPNLLAKEALVPEFIQDAVTAKNLSEAVLTYLDDGEKTRILQGRFRSLHESLKQDADQKAAQAVLDLLV